RDRLPPAAGGRPQAAPPRHHQGSRDPGLGAHHVDGGGPGASSRLLRERSEREPVSEQAGLERYIRSVPDFPVPGILYRDITPLLADPGALRVAVELMSAPWRGRGVDLVASMEARGFIFGAGIALDLGAGFVPVRKSGKLPWKTREVRYTLEYGSDVLHMHEDAVAEGQKVLVVDDLIATGETA